MANPNPSSPIVWVDHSLECGTSSNPFSHIFSTGERIIQSVMMKEEPWEDYHHCSHLPAHIEDYSNELNHHSIVDFLSNFVFIDTVDSERNMSNIEETISINISTKPNIVKKNHVGKSCSPLELDIYHALFHEF